MKLHELKPAKGSRRERKRVGRGIAAGQGKTSGRGQKGQGARESWSVPKGFEGGQMPMTQRFPKLRGFHNRFHREYAVLNLSKLNRFDAKTVVDGAALAAAGLIAHPDARVKLLAAGRVKVGVTVRVHRASAAAQAALEKAGGKVELLEQPAAAESEPAKKKARAKPKAQATAETEPEAEQPDSEPEAATEETETEE